MKNRNVRSGFTMIELIFVIVVLGILSAVAMPKFVNVQDDAIVSSEKAGIGSIRSAIAMLKGKAEIKRDNRIMTIVGADGSKKTLFVEYSKNLYPLALSTTTSQNSLSKTGTTNSTLRNYANSITPSIVNTDLVLTDNYSNGDDNEFSDPNYKCDSTKTDNCMNTLALVLDNEARLNYRTSAVKDNKMYIEGEATRKNGVDNDISDTSLEIDYKGAWLYDSKTGTINYHKAYSDGTEIEYKFNNFSNL